MPGGSPSGKPLDKMSKPELFVLTFIGAVLTGYVWYQAFINFNANIFLLLFGLIFFLVFVSAAKEWLKRP